MEGIKSPLVSVCIPVFNGKKYLIEALESVKAQSYSNFELVISDDNSSDDSMELVKDFLLTFKKPHKIVINYQRGIGNNWNNCVRNASGDYIKFLFQDDILFHDCLSRMVSIAESDPKVGMVYSDRAILMDPGNLAHLGWLNANGKIMELWNKPFGEGIYLGERILRDKNLFLNKPYNKIGEPTSILYKKLVFSEVGMFDTELVQFLDLEFSLRVLSKFRFGYINQELAGFRLHENQASNEYSKLNVNERPLFFKKIGGGVFLKMAWISKKIVAKESLPPLLVNLVKRVKSLIG